MAKPRPSQNTNPNKASSKPSPNQHPADEEGETPAEATLFQSLGHPLRRRILRLLHQHGPTPYTRLRDTLRLEPGTLYFHLDQLQNPAAPLIKQRRDRLYQLTPLGHVAASFLARARDLTPSTAPPPPATSHPRLRRAARLLGLTPLHRHLTNRPDHFAAEALLTLAATAYLNTRIPLTAIGLLPLDLPAPPIHPALTLLASWLGLATATELITRLRYHAATGYLSLLAATAFAWLPLTIYALTRLLAAPLLAASPLATPALLLATLTWSLWIYTQAITHTKQITPQKAATTTVIITNITLILTVLTALTLPHP